MYEIKLNDPTLSKGVVVNLDGVGDIPNGGSITVDADAEATFRIRHGKATPTKNGPKWTPGPTFAEAFGGSPILTITELKDNGGK